MTAPSFQDIDTIARACAGACGRAYGVPFEDLYQEAWCELLRAQRTWDPAKGPFANYGSRAARVYLLGYVARYKSPVHGHNRVLKELLGARRVLASHAETLPHGSGSPEACLARREFDREISERLESVFAKCPDGHLARANMLDKKTAKHLAKKHHTTVFRVMRAVRHAKQLVKKDPVLRKFKAS